VEAGEAKYLNRSSTAEGAEKKMRNFEFASKLCDLREPALNWKFNEFYGGDNASNLA
jgi:hypothetical protein